MTLWQWLGLGAVLFLICSVLAAIAFWCAKLADRVMELQSGPICPVCEKDEATWSGKLSWPIDDDFVLDGLRAEAGDDDDHRRTQLESVIRITERRH